ncbi:BZ3500_MvSof-1268-A1-R1_Chr9g10872 [Microbotryum saponariae]|uniref:BZ3500_MvSof-1268-A1-R1_Chr9g10872 protein n=1 Tax=Microbotryum saponariae TaxID=289078 RepID=A0A2X0L871_9BASI|nr:BZ3501_MvSof-1269-A2-R1_Chr9g10620 [Microbotryum saponariae]SDA00838.1 BZ3500_MvSof-1268-A1-R1_Chr9g10872 [Microbotryum saponariae]
MSHQYAHKRPNVFGDDDDPNAASPKRIKQAGTPSYLPPSEGAAAATPAAPPAQAPPSNGHRTTTSSSSGSSSAYTAPIASPRTTSTAPPVALDLIAAKQAEIRAKLAAMRAGQPLSSSAAIPGRPNAPPPTSAAVPPKPPIAIPLGAQPNLDPDLAKKIADAKKLVEAMAAKKRAAQAPVVNPYLSGGTITQLPRTLAAANDVDASSGGRGGLAVAAHPLLMDLGKASTTTETNRKDRYKPMAPKFSSVKANASLPSSSSSSRSSNTGPLASTSSTPIPDSIVDTPFFDPSLAHRSAGTSGRSHMGRGHVRETLKFNQKGKYIKMGEAQRAEARMEDLKRRILESAKAAGIEGEMEDKAKLVKRPPPPDIEWWDAPFLPSKTYDSFSPQFLSDASNSPSSTLVTHYVHHPIQIPAPQDKIKVEAKPLFLTKKEMKKMRKQRRMAELKDRQDRIKMGLLPPDPPKGQFHHRWKMRRFPGVKLSNMMRVLTQEAVLDPTKIENKVRREMVARERTHLKANAERKLSPEERRAKIEAQALADEQKGIGAMCFKIRYLTNPSHRFKVKKNAVDDHLTGVVVHNPKFCLVVVEGGHKGLKHYKQLMLNRIDWTEDARPRELPEGIDDPKDFNSSGLPKAGTTTFAPEDAPTSLADNYCTLIWEGQHRERLFRDMRHANCPAENNVKDVLGKKLEGLWDVAKIEVKEEE